MIDRDDGWTYDGWATTAPEPSMASGKSGKSGGSGSGKNGKESSIFTSIDEPPAPAPELEPPVNCKTTNAKYSWS